MKYFIKRNKKITNSILNKFYWVHNGKYFYCIYITKEIINFKIGDYVFTRKQ